MNATNLSPVYFSSANNVTSLNTTTGNDVIDTVWSEFLAGNWATNMTFGIMNYTATGIWTFKETDSDGLQDLQFLT